MNIIPNANNIICNGIIHLNHFEYGIPARPIQAINTPDVGKIAFENPSPNWNIKTVVCLDLSSMVAGAKYRGEFEERMKSVLNELKNSEDLILFIDEIHTIVGAGSAEGALDASNIIKPSLARGHIQVIGATTTKEYRRYIEIKASF